MTHRFETPAGGNLETLLDETDGGAGAGAGQVLKRRGDRIVVRRQTAEGPVIIKMWARPDVRGAVRRWLGIGSCDYEWRNLILLHAAGVRVPQPLGRSRVPPNGQGFTDAIFLEDLGDCSPVMGQVKALLREGDEPGLRRIEGEVVELAERMLAAGLIDTDHGFLNTVVTPAGHVARLDLEMGRRVIWPRLCSTACGRMLGRMISTYIFAVQPEVRHAERFVTLAAQRLKPSARARRIAERDVRRRLDGQRRKRGIDVRFVWNWA